MEVFSDINRFLNSPQVVEVLYALVLIMALLWLLTGGSSFRRKRPDSERRKEKQHQNQNQDHKKDDWQ